MRTAPDVAAALGKRPAAPLAVAALYRLLAEAFAYLHPGHARHVAEMFRRLPSPHGADPRLRHALARAERTWASANEEALQAEYARLFLGNAACSLHETAYGDGRRIAGRTAELADIAGFYAAFGFAISEADPDLPDHLCAELEFCSLLLLKSAYGARNGWSASGRIVEHALRKFLQDHLGRWVGAFGAELGRAAAQAPYRELAGLLDLLLGAEMKRLRARSAPFSGLLPADIMQLDDLACPAKAVVGRA